MKKILLVIFALSCSYWAKAQDIDTICINSGIIYQDLSTTTVAWQWDIKNGNVQGNPPDYTQKNSPPVFYPATGSFNVYCYITHSNGQKDTLWFITVVIDPKINNIPIPADTASCNGVTVNLDAGQHEGKVTYKWFEPDGDSSITSRTINATLPGNYIVRVKNQCKTVYDTTSLVSVPVPLVVLPENLIVCNGEITHTLDAGNPGAKYLWNTGDSTQTIDVSTGGTYSVTVTNAGGCSGTAKTIIRDSCPPEYYFPSAFSPNEDLLNDYYTPYLKGIVHIKFRIYDRWGEVLYSADEAAKSDSNPNMNIAWDGTFRGKNATIGVYTYTANMLTKDGVRINTSGNISLIR